jgi:hypothetical protein
MITSNVFSDYLVDLCSLECIRKLSSIDESVELWCPFMSYLFCGVYMQGDLYHSDKNWHNTIWYLWVFFLVFIYCFRILLYLCELSTTCNILYLDAQKNSLIPASQESERSCVWGIRCWFCFYFYYFRLYFGIVLIVR